MSLFDIEIQSQKIRERLQSPISNKLKLSYLITFLKTITENVNPKIYLSYYEEFEPELSGLINKEEFYFLSPEDYDIIIKIIHFFISLPLFSQKDFDELINKLNSQKERMLYLLGNSRSNMADKDNQTIEGSTKNYLNIVLVEQDYGYGSIPPCGNIEKLKLDSSVRHSKETDDKIEFNNMIDIKESEILQQFTHSVKLAKIKCNKEGIKTRLYNFSFSFDRKDCIFTGKSVGIGAVSLAYNSVLINELSSKYYKFYNDVVFSGEIDNKGFLTKLDRDSIAVKLKNVFFSPYRKLVIPEENILDANLILSEFHKKYPNKELKIIPIKYFQDVFKNLHIVEVCKLKLREKVKSKYQPYHRIVNWSLSIITITLIIYLLVDYFIPYWDRNPVYAKVEASRFKAYNKYGKEVWKSEFLNPYEIRDKLQRIVISDLDNDGKNEIIILRRDDALPLLQKTVFCYNSDNSLKWKVFITPKDSLYGNEICYDRVDLRNVFVIENRKTKQKEIIADYIVCDLFPYFITKLDSKGKEISSFYNSGNTDLVKLFDLDDDGENELVIGGTNNDYNRRGCLIIFDLEFIEGKGPGYRYPHGFSHGLMKYYILFPKIFLTMFSDKQASDINGIGKYNNKITADLRESMDSNKEDKYYRTIFNFDPKFNFLHLQTSTAFDVKYRELIAAGKIQPIKDWKAYEDSLRKEIRFWDGDKFVNYPTMNKYYLIAKNSLKKTK